MNVDAKHVNVDTSKLARLTFPPVMNTEQVAEYLNCHTSSIYRMIKRKVIPFFKVGSDYRFHRDAIDQWALAQSAENGEPSA